MSDSGLQIMPIVITFSILIFITGIYYMVATRNLIRVLIGLEILSKAVTLFIVAAGYFTGKSGLAQTFVITVIVAEVVVIAIAAGIIMGIYREHNSLDPENITNLKG